MFGSSKKTTNIGHQLLQRETNIGCSPKEFAANLFRERFSIAKNLYTTDLRGHFGCVNAIEFSHGGTFLASGGDDKRVLVWDVEKSLAGISTPRALATEQASNIFCLGFDSKNRKLISGGNDTLAISHDFETGKLDNVFKHDGPVYGLSIDPQNDNVFSSASENGEILLFDQRSTTPTVIASVPSSFHAVEFHPTLENLLVTANSKRGATLYDLRYPKQPVILYGNLGNPRSCMSVRFNRSGKLILALRRRLPPILYNVNSSDPICTFYHSNYYNSCTMKSCTFAGEDDEMVISGSDDFNLYVWRLSDIDLEATEQWVESTQMVLFGHRSIVNQVRYNREKCLMASSGVEKIIKIWSPFSQHNWAGSLIEEASCSDNPRELFTPYNLFTMALPENWHHLSHDYSSENTNEDPRMMAFFDSLIQQEIEDWETDSSGDPLEQVDHSISSFFSCGSTSSSNNSGSNNNTSKSSSSASSSSSDSDSENSGLTKRRRRSKRQVLIRRKIQHKQRNKKTKLNQFQKHTNRITYLIAKKRNTLRRLALKGTSLNNKRSNKPAIVANGRKHLKQSHCPRSVRHRQVRKKHVGNCINNEKPSTSAAALAENSQILLGENIQKKQSETDTNGSLEENSCNFAIGSSSHSNVTKTSCSSNININAPSTSTGITSNLRDAFLRLSKIFVSDSDDSDGPLECAANKINNNFVLRSERKESDKVVSSSKTCITTANESRTNTSRSLRSNQRPRNSAAINVINSKTILPQSHPTKSESSLNINNDYSENKDRSLFSRKNGHKRMADLLDSDDADEIKSINSCKNHKKRLCFKPNGLDDSPTTSPSNSNNSYRNEHFEENTTSSTSTSLPSQKDVSKRQKVSLNGFIKARNGFNNKNLVGQETFENHNERNTNELFANEPENVSNHGHLTPQKSNKFNRESSCTESYEYTMCSPQHNNNNFHLFTPDSGIGLSNSSTPRTIEHNLINSSTSSAGTGVAAYLSPCYEHNDCDVKNIEKSEGDDDEGVALINNRKTNLNQFQQKIARVRRNYRKQIFDDTESD